jgi:hypothetical protein
MIRLFLSRNIETQRTRVDNARARHTVRRQAKQHRAFEQVRAAW